MTRQAGTRGIHGVGPRARTLGAILLTAAVVPLVGCSGGSSSQADQTGPPGPAAEPLLRVVATLDIPAAGNVVTTRNRLWVISGGKTIVTQIDPQTNAISRRVSLPHPVAYGTVADESLWLVSYGDNALIELDAQTGKVLRTLESSPALPLSDPVGIAATGRDLWVLNHHNSRLLRIDQQTGTLTGITELPGDAAAGPFLVGHTLWVAMTVQGLLYRVDPVSGKIVGRPLHVPTGLCVWESIIGHDIWATSVPFGDFACTNGLSRVDTTTGHVTALASAEGKSLYTLTRYAGSLWATDLGTTLYQVDRSGSLNPVLNFDRKDTSHLFSAFGSLWITRPGHGQLLRLKKL